MTVILFKENIGNKKMIFNKLNRLESIFNCNNIFSTFSLNLKNNKYYFSNCYITETDFVLEFFTEDAILYYNNCQLKENLKKHFLKHYGQFNFEVSRLKDVVSYDKIKLKNVKLSFIHKFDNLLLEEELQYDKSFFEDDLFTNWLNLNNKYDVKIKTSDSTHEIEFENIIH